MTWNSGSMSDDFTGPTVKEAEDQERNQDRKRDEMDPFTRAVSDTLDEYLERIHGVTTSHTYPTDFITFLAENGLRLQQGTKKCVNDNNGDGDCAACARNPEAPCRQYVFSNDVDNVYRERNHMVAAYAAAYPSQFVIGADPKYPTWAVVFVKLPSGQTSWHIGPHDFDLFDFMPQMQGGEEAWTWDGHSTDEKYFRVDKNSRSVYAKRMAPEDADPTPQSPYGDPVTEIDEDFYIHGDKVMCRLEHSNAGDNILGKVPEETPESDDKLEAMLREHDRVHHNGPGDCSH
ncbi:hypothetical protein GCM10010423_64860 [Streptomyces levis]|uniref:Uncharacterized protein n=1 Tax=Streptomyces levis TaxID=285566 RepID=A0ABN3P6J5_9ACTN